MLITVHMIQKVIHFYCGFFWRVTILRDKETRESKGVAFVLFLDRQTAHKAVAAVNKKQVHYQLHVINPLHLNISMHILHVVLYTFPKALKVRIWFTITSFFSLWSIPFIRMTLMFDSGDIVWRNVMLVPLRLTLEYKIVHVSLPAYYFIKCKASSKTLYMYIIRAVHLFVSLWMVTFW